MIATMASSLRSPKHGLIWSIPNQPDDVLVSNGLRRGHLFSISEAVLYHGFDFVQHEWTRLKEEGAVSAKLAGYVDGMMDNIKIGVDNVNAAQHQAQATSGGRLKEAC